MTLLAPFFAELAAGAERPALFDAAGRSFTYAALDRWSHALAAQWRLRGITPGRRVLVALPMAPPLYAALIALWRLGAVAVFPEPAMGFSGLRHAVAMAEPRAVIAPLWLAALCRVRFGLPRLPLADADARGGAGEPADVPRDHPALITFTSGSTGSPKGIVRSHGFLLAQQQAMAPVLHAPGAVDLVSLPIFVLADLGFGVASVIPDGPLRRPAEMPPERLLRQIERHRVTRVLAPPAVCARLAEVALPAHLEKIITGGGPVFPNLVRRLRRAAPAAEVIAVYGSTEAEPIAHTTLSAASAEDWRRMEQGGGLLAGRPTPPIRLDLLGDEIVVTGAHVNKGYLRAADDARTKLRRDGEIWHRTGDAGRLDEQGRLWLLGRVGAQVGGLHPFAVEVAALSWPGVAQAALTDLDGSPVLALAGDAADARSWHEGVAGFAGLTLRILPRIPLDRRHNSKIDYPALAAALRTRTT